MKKILLLCMLLPTLFVQAQEWKWGKQSNNAATEGWPVATDTAGNVYVSGYASNNFGAFFDFFSVPYSGYTSGSSQSFIAKYDSAGNIQWAKGFLNSTSVPISITTDKQGNLIYFGLYGSPSIQWGTFILHNPVVPYYESFLLKLRPDGTVIWGKNTGNANTMSILFDMPLATNVWSCGGIATDKNSNIYMTEGYQTPTVSIGTYTFTNADPSGTSTDILTAKFDSAGNLKWATSTGGKYYDDPLGITVLPDSSIYIAGAFLSDSLSFGSTLLTNVNSASHVKKAFIAHYNSSGSPIWAESAGGPGGAYAIAPTSDTFGNVFVTGAYADSNIVFDTTTVIGPYPGRTSVYLLKLNSSGNVEWYKSLATPSSYVMSYSLALGSCKYGNVTSGGSHSQVWISGLLRDSASVDGHLLRTPAGSYDPIFLIGYDQATGNFLDMVALPTGGDDQDGIVCDNFGNVLLCSDLVYGYTLHLGSDILLGDNPASGEYLTIGKYYANICEDSDPTTSIPEVGVTKKIVLYPNPVTDILNISSVTPMTSIVITDILGQTVYAKQCNSPLVQVDISILPSGTYLVKADGAEIQRFLKF